MSKLFEFDKGIWAEDNSPLLCAFDEAGMGCIAGSCFIGCVVFPQFDKLPEELMDVKDSKKLSEQRRQELEKAIKKHALYWWVGEVTVEEIAEGSLYHLRYQKAADLAKKMLKKRDESLVVYFDGNKSLDIPGDSRFLIKGDAKSLSIAAASILAKTSKDREMLKLDKELPEYGFAKHKGYATKAHGENITKFGLSHAHRASYCKKYVKFQRSYQII